MKAPKDHFIIQIDVTNACVHKCSNCTRFCGQIAKPYFMDFEYFCKAVDTLLDHPGLIGVMGGEPTLHPRFEDMCKYLQEKVGSRYPTDIREVKYPTDHPVEMRLRSQLKHYEIEEYDDGPRAIIRGTGLWTSVTPAYLKYYEIIQDTFNWQNLNDHSNASFHQPILISRKELGIDDKLWIKLREKCWVNQEWSGSVTPKGCFFCEVAGAFDMLYDGPGGLPLEDGWWKRPIEDYKDQFRWCEMCGIPLKTFSRDAREEMDDISPYHYDRFKTSEKVSLGRKKNNILDIRNGTICNKNNSDTEKYRGLDYIDDAHDRVSHDSPILAKEFYGLILDDGTYSIDEILSSINLNSQYFVKLMLLSSRKDISAIGNDISVIQYGSDNSLMKLREVIDSFGKMKYVILFTPNVVLSKAINQLKKCVINPGTLHYIDYSKSHNNLSNAYIENSRELRRGICMLINNGAHSYNNLHDEKGSLIHCIRNIGKQWDRSKIVEFSNMMNRYIYVDNNPNGVNRICNLGKIVHQFIQTYGIYETARFCISTLRHYGVKLTTSKVRGRVY